jgi:hypothetical protein
MKLRLSVPLLVLLATFVFAAGCSSVPGDAKTKDNTAEQSSHPPFAEAKSGVVSPRTLVPDQVTVPAGTAITVRLQSEVSSASSRAGDEFMAVVDDPVVVDGQTVAPRGTTAQGRVIAARASGRLHNSGYLRLTLVSLELNGKSSMVHTSSLFAAGGEHKKRNLALIGGGAGASALIGALAGGGKGALVGGAVGAGAGTAGAYATGKKDVSFAPERRLTFRLTQGLVVKR